MTTKRITNQKELKEALEVLVGKSAAVFKSLKNEDKKNVKDAIAESGLKNVIITRSSKGKLIVCPYDSVAKHYNECLCGEQEFYYDMGNEHELVSTYMGFEDVDEMEYGGDEYKSTYSNMGMDFNPDSFLDNAMDMDDYDMDFENDMDDYETQDMDFGRGMRNAMNMENDMGMGRGMRNDMNMDNDTMTFDMLYSGDDMYSGDKDMNTNGYDDMAYQKYGNDNSERELKRSYMERKAIRNNGNGDRGREIREMLAGKGRRSQIREAKDSKFDTMETFSNDEDAIKWAEESEVDFDIKKLKADLKKNALSLQNKVLIIVDMHGLLD